MIAWDTVVGHINQSYRVQQIDIWAMLLTLLLNLFLESSYAWPSQLWFKLQRHQNKTNLEIIVITVYTAETGTCVGDHNWLWKIDRYFFVFLFILPLDYQFPWYIVTDFSCPRQRKLIFYILRHWPLYSLSYSLIHVHVKNWQMESNRQYRSNPKNDKRLSKGYMYIYEGPGCSNYQVSNTLKIAVYIKCRLDEKRTWDSLSLKERSDSLTCLILIIIIYGTSV